LVTAILINLFILIYFKYLNFFLDILNLSNINSIILPAGISFITFHSISYLIDVYDKKILPEKKFSNFFLFIFMFPQVISGPITRYSKVYKSINLLKNFYFKYGIYCILLGLFQKIIIADHLALYVNEFYSDKNFLFGINGADSLLVSFIYIFQLYFDFSGYSHIAIGLALIMGIRLPKNFNFPLSSFSISEFWKKWHISLSTFIRDYLFIKINKLFNIQARENTPKYFGSIVICMVLSGLWHGANFTFLIWGLIHGLLICLEKYFNFILLNRIILKIYFIISLSLSFIFFRSESINQAFTIITSIFENFNLNEMLIYQYFNIKFFLILCMCLFFSSKKNKLIIYNFRKFLIKNLFGRILLTLMLLFLFTEILTQNYSPFIYFRF